MYEVYTVVVYNSIIYRCVYVVMCNSIVCRCVTGLKVGMHISSKYRSVKLSDFAAVHIYSGLLHFLNIV